MKYLSISTEIKDSNGEVMIFAIDENRTLSVTLRVDSESGWVRHELMTANQGLKAQVFGISKNSAGDIYLVLAAGREPSGQSQLFITQPLSDKPDDPIWQTVKDHWTPLHINPAPAHITEILVGAPESASETPLIVIGTTETNGKVPRYLRIKTEVSIDNVETFPTLEDADELLDIQVGRSVNARGVYVLYRRGDNTVLEFDHLPDPDYDVSVVATLITPPGAMELDTKVTSAGFTDLHVNGNGKFRFGYDNQTAHAQAEKIADDDAILINKITSRSSITEEYRKKTDSTGFETYPVYRTSISLPVHTVVVDLWASEETDVEINGVKYTIDPVMPARVTVPLIRKLSIALPAEQLRCPYLLLRTNLMRPEQRHVIYPDVEIHKKIVDLKDGALHEAREQLGIKSEFTETELGHVQKTLQNLTQTIQYTYNRKPHGIHHDRAVLPRNMDDPHFMLEFKDGKTQYTALDKGAVGQHIVGATLLQGHAAQNFLDDLGDFFNEAGAIIVHTVEGIGRDIIDTAEHIYDDAVITVQQTGEDLVHGDARRLMEHFIQGGEAIGRHLFEGAANVVGDLVSGAGQLVVVTLKLADKAVQFILHDTGIVGQVLGWIFEKIGATLEKVIDWLLDKLGWDDILHTHDVFKEAINNGLDQIQGLLELAKTQVDAEFKRLEDDITNSINAMLQQLGTRQMIEQPSPPTAFSGSTEKGEWLLTRFSAQSGSLTVERESEYPITAILPGLDELITRFEQTFGINGEKALAAFGDTRKLLDKISSQPNLTLELVLSVFLELAKDTAIFGLTVINTIVDTLIDLAEELFSLFKKIINTPITIPFISDLYKHLTKGRELTLLDFASLLIATPATLLFKAIEGHAPFAEVASAATSLPPEGLNANKSLSIRAWGISYGAARAIQGVFQSISDVDAAVRMFPNAPAGANNAGQGSTLAATKEFFLDTWPWGLNFVVTVAAQLMSCPSGVPGDLSISFPPERFRLTTIRRSEWITPVTWIINWFPITVSLGCRIASRSSSAKSNAILLDTLSSAAFGAVSLGLYVWQDITDGEKYKTLKEDYFVIRDEDVNIKLGYKCLKEDTDGSWQDSWLKNNVLSTIDLYNNVSSSVYAWHPKHDNGQDKIEYFYVPTKRFSELTADTLVNNYQVSEVAKYYDKAKVIETGDNELNELHTVIGDKEFKTLYPKGPSDEEKLKVGAVRIKRDFVMFLKWAEQGGANDHPTVGGVRRLWGIERKTFSYVASALPSIGQILTVPIFSEPSEGASVGVTAAIDLLFCMSEGITVIVRTGLNEYMY